MFEILDQAYTVTDDSHATIEEKNAFKELIFKSWKAVNEKDPEEVKVEIKDTDNRIKLDNTKL